MDSDGIKIGDGGSFGAFEGCETEVSTFDFTVYAGLFGCVL